MSRLEPRTEKWQPLERNLLPSILELAKVQATAFYRREAEIRMRLTP